MKGGKPSDAEQDFAVEVGNWLALQNPPSETLLNWLQEFDVPSESYGLRAYQWIMRVIPHNHRRPEAKARLARSLVLLLDAQPDIKPLSALPFKFLENLLLLCGSLERPDELAEPLYALYLRNCPLPDGVMADPALRSALRTALTYNQVDDRLRPVWERLLQGEPDPCVIGNPYAGFDGMLYKPASTTTRGQPDLDAIGTALTLMASYLQTDKAQRNRRFDQLIDLVRTAYPQPAAFWNARLLQQALSKQLPQWSLLRLPSLCLINRAGKSFLWRPIYDVVASNPGWASELIKEYSGEIVEVVLSPEAADFVEWVTPKFDTRRLCNPWPSARAAYATAIDSCRDLADWINVHQRKDSSRPRATGRRARRPKGAKRANRKSKPVEEAQDDVAGNEYRSYQFLGEKEKNFTKNAGKALRTASIKVSEEILATK